MLAVNYSTIRDNLKSYCDKVTDEKETVIVTRKDGKNVVLVSMNEWNDLQKAVRNAEYVGKIRRAADQVARGEVITKSFAELEAMETDE